MGGGPYNADPIKPEPPEHSVPGSDVSMLQLAQAADFASQEELMLGMSPRTEVLLVVFFLAQSSYCCY